MTRREPNFDLDRAVGEQSELWVNDVRRALASNGRVKIKAPKPWLKEQSFFVEYACLRKSKWTKSGINASTADLWFVTFGSLPGGLVVDRQWLFRAAKLAFNKGKTIECKIGSHPTKGVLVSLTELWETRSGEP